jgi:allantoinase
VSWSADRKDDPDMLANASGAPGLEALYPLLLKGLEERRLSFTHAARLLAHNPAQLFRLAERKGALALGRDADIVLAYRDPYRYRAGESGANVVDWSPYDGLEFPYRIDSAFLRGEAVLDEGRVIAEPGNGRFLRPAARSAA